MREFSFAFFDTLVNPNSVCGITYHIYHKFQEIGACSKELVESEMIIISKNMCLLVNSSKMNGANTFSKQCCYE
jgi:hypothetical protein